LGEFTNGQGGINKKARRKSKKKEYEKKGAAKNPRPQLLVKKGKVKVWEGQSKGAGPEQKLRGTRGEKKRETAYSVTAIFN